MYSGQQKYADTTYCGSEEHAEDILIGMGAVDHAHTTPVIGVDSRSSEEHAEYMMIGMGAVILQSPSPPLHRQQILQSGQPEAAALALLNLKEKAVAVVTTPPDDDFVATRDDDQSNISSSK